MRHPGVPADASAAADVLAIRNVVAALARTADADDVDAYVELFAPDAVWAMPGGERRGRDDIRAGSLERRAAGVIGPGSGTRHVVTTTVVELDGERAGASSTWLFLTGLGGDGPPTVAGAGAYDDELVRVDGCWLLDRRSITFG